MSGPLVFPVGHYMGARRPEGDHLVRVGLAHRVLTEDEFGVWVLAHGLTAAADGEWTEAHLVSLAENAGLAAPREALARLLDNGSLVVVGRGGADATVFAETYRLEPLLVGLGNTDDDPDRYAVGFPGLPPVATLDVGSYELWQWGHVAPSLWHTCEVRAKVVSGLGEPVDAAGVVGEVLGDLRALLMGSCAYLDLARQE